MEDQKKEKIEITREILSEYLEKNKLRKTPERFAILHEIYNRNDHFDAETLYKTMINKGFNVSRATVYNTLDILLECELVVRHQFGKSQSVYEKSYGYRQHDHLICLDCGVVKEFCDPRIQQIENMVGELMQFEVDHHSLTLYGKCTKIDCEFKAMS
ncbi:MAG: transcriptional repressor [Chitinophagaceae bacterium]|nr:MAG: transcriptional repressor [Chitinophagaceae bacterium]